MSELAHETDQLGPQAEEAAGQAPGATENHTGSADPAAGVPGQIGGDESQMPDSNASLLDDSEHLYEHQDASANPAPVSGEGPVSQEPAAASPAAGPQTLTASDVSGRPLPRINIQAFCEEQNTVNILQQAGQDRRLSKTHFNVQMGGLDAAVQYYGDAPTPNLIIIESMQGRDALLMDMDRLASVCDEGTKVIVVGHVND
ncbi:unnamed protein product, partial [marine sediment metagenome]